LYQIQVPEFIDPRFRETSPKRSLSVIENERFWLVFANTGSIISGKVHVRCMILIYVEE
jgi:hypothetical protein